MVGQCEWNYAPLSLSALLSLPISRPPLFPNSYNLVVEDSFLKYFYAPLS